MELSQAVKSLPGINYIKIGIIIGVAIFVYFLLRKFGIFKSDAEKIEEKKDTEAKQGAATFEKSTVLEPIKISNFLQMGIGKNELKNQFPYQPSEVVDMVRKIKKDEPVIGYSKGENTLSVVKSLPSKFAFTRLGLSFNKLYGIDLMTWMKNNLKDVAEADIENTLSLKPDFVTPLKATQDYLTKHNLTLTL
jgi:hypothetical protein